MWAFLRRQALTVLVGFVIAFVVYLFIRFDATEVIEGVAIGIGAGLALAMVLFFLERRFPGEPRKG